jgi:hypothetical protein
MRPEVEVRYSVLKSVLPLHCNIFPFMHQLHGEEPFFETYNRLAD